MNKQQIAANTIKYRQAILDNLPIANNTGDISQLLGLDYYSTNYHVTELIKLGCIIKVGTIRKGGSTAFVYRKLLDVYQHPVASNAPKAKPVEFTPAHPIAQHYLRQVKLEDYQERYAETQKLRVKPRQNVWLGTTLGTMIF